MRVERAMPPYGTSGISSTDGAPLVLSFVVCASVHSTRQCALLVRSAGVAFIGAESTASQLSEAEYTKLSSKVEKPATFFAHTKLRSMNLVHA